MRINEAKSKKEADRCKSKSQIKIGEKWRSRGPSMNLSKLQVKKFYYEEKTIISWTSLKIWSMKSLPNIGPRKVSNREASYAKIWTLWGPEKQF